MRKSFYLLIFSASIALTSCSTVLTNLPGVYSIDIQQGNIVNQEMIDQLRPKMTKRQVLYIMGSPMIADVFHQKRWDYLYSDQPGGEARRQKRLTLFFDGDELIGVQGDFRPSSLPVITQSHDTTVEVPKRDLDKTLWGKMKNLWNDDQPKTLEDLNDDSPIITKSDKEVTKSSDAISDEAELIDKKSDMSNSGTETNDTQISETDTDTKTSEGDSNSTEPENGKTESITIDENDEIEQQIKASDISIEPLEEEKPQVIEEIQN